MKTKHILVVLSVLFFSQAGASCVDSDGEVNGPIFSAPSDMLPDCRPADQVLSLKAPAKPAKAKKAQPEDCRDADGNSKLGSLGDPELLPLCR